MAININFSCFIYIMNKLLKYILIGIGITSLCIASVNAGFDEFSQNDFYFRNIINGSTTTINSDGNELFCVYVDSNCNGNNCGTLTADGVTYDVKGSWGGNVYCAKGNNISFTPSSNYYYYIFSLNFFETIYPQYTSLQCQTEYNLIPISEVTPNYCALNFGMIDPQECPINSGTGAIIRSNLMINDIPYAQNQNINVFIPDFLAWNISFNDLYTVIEVEGYDADTEYIENVINNEKMTPTNEDFTNMLTGLTNLFPYLAIAFLMYWLIRLVYKSFK